MLLHPTRRALHLSWTGVIVVFVGILQQRGDITLYGAALLLGVVSARSWSKISVARARAAGFEMLWLHKESTTHCQTHQPQWLTLQLRNRDSLPTRFINFSVMAASNLKVEPQLTQGEIPAQGSLDIKIKVIPLQLGVHGIFGISLATLRAPGLYKVPLAFTNPHTLQVEPGKSSLVNLRQLSRSRARHSTTGYSTRGGNEGQDFRDIREKGPGDPFKKIAWKPSARRGKLLVIDREDESRERVWILIDSSYEFFKSGKKSSPINQQAERARMLCHQHLRRGDLVGIALLGARNLCQIRPDRGPRHQSLIESALTYRLHTQGSDRSAWGSEQIKAQAIEFIRQLEPESLISNLSSDHELEKKVIELMNKSSLKLVAPYAATPSDQLLRQFLLTFGIQSPPKIGQERLGSEFQATRLLNQVAYARPRTNIIHLVARIPNLQTQPAYFNALAQMKRLRISVALHPLTRMPNPELNFSEKIEEELSLQRSNKEKQKILLKLRARGVKVMQAQGSNSNDLL